jgi:hypothetical protein
MGKSRKPSAKEAFTAQGQNGMSAFASYKFRKFYKDQAYPTFAPDYGPHEAGMFVNPLPIDMWYEKPYFGRYDLGGNPIYLLEKNLKQLSTSNAQQPVFAVNFVSDAFQDLKSHFTQALISKKINEDFPLSTLPVSQAYVSPETLYQKYINNLFQVFILSYIGGNGLHCTISSFEDFLKHFRDYFRSFGLGNPFTLSGFIGSKRCPANICGLFIDMQPSGFSSDLKKVDQFMSKNDFSFFASSAKNHGFLVDKNVPWRLVADISSPKMREYMGNYVKGLNQDNLFDNYYTKAYVTDIEIMMNNIVSFYNNYISSRPLTSKPTHVYTRGDVGTTREIHKTVTKNKKRNKIGIKQILDRYGIENVLEFYFMIKTYEVGLKLEDFSIDSIIAEASARKEILGLNFALSYLNSKITDQVKINLTIGTEYVKGNNEKARQLLNARQPKNDEPNIKDVISGDYSRK